jgi:hypothetical protein
LIKWAFALKAAKKKAYLCVENNSFPKKLFSKKPINKNESIPISLMDVLVTNDSLLHISN